jgi:hypothetical protein
MPAARIEQKRARAILNCSRFYHNQFLRLIISYKQLRLQESFSSIGIPGLHHLRINSRIRHCVSVAASAFA